MASTISEVQDKSEVWVNTSAGTRWFKCLDIQGRETSKAVRGERTFTLTTFERQLNQHAAASPEQDLFRNGTFVLKKASVDTDPDEVASPNAMTEAELVALGNEVMYGERSPEEVIQHITSSPALARLVEFLVLEEAKPHLIAAVKERQKEFETPKPKTIAATKPDDEFDAVKAPVTEAIVKTTPETPKSDQSEGSEQDGG